MSKARIKRDDTVIVIAGKDKGKVGRVLRVMPEDERLVVEGVRRVKRHVKPVGENPGTITEKENPIAVSNVALWNAAEKRRIKVGFKILDDGKKIRVDKKTGQAIDNA